jgi:hypothetical protein
VRAGVAFGLAALVLGISFGVLARPLMGPARFLPMGVALAPSLTGGAARRAAEGQAAAGPCWFARRCS